MDVFGWVKNLGKEERASPEDPRTPLSGPDEWLYEALGVAPTDSGLTVNERTSLNYTTVFACVRVLSETIASLPLMVYESEDRGKRPARETREWKVLHTAPNPENTSFTWRELMVSGINLWGNSYTEIQWDRSGRLYALWPLAPSIVNVREGSQRGEIIYTVHDKSGGRRINQDDILHVPGMGFDGLTGLSPIRLHREAITLGMVATKAGARFFSNDATPGGVLEHPNNLSEDAIKRLRNQFEERHRGPEKVRRVFVAEEGMKFNAVSMPMRDAQFLETRQFQRTEICSIFRVPPHMIGDLTKATFSNIEQQSIDFYVNVVVPWLKRIEMEINRKLFKPQEPFFAEFKTAGLLRGDSAARSAYYRNLFGIGVLSQNDIRELENMNSIGPDGDKYYVPLNMKASDEPDPDNPDDQGDEGGQGDEGDQGDKGNNVPSGALPVIRSAGRPVPAPVVWETLTVETPVEEKLGVLWRPWGDAYRRAVNYDRKNEDKHTLAVRTCFMPILVTMSEIMGNASPETEDLLRYHAAQVAERIRVQGMTLDRADEFSQTEFNLAITFLRGVQ